MTELPRRAFVAQIMGLPISVHVRGPQAEQPAVAQAVDRLFADLRADDDMFSTWKPDSPLSRIRDGRDRLADAHPRIRQVAALCELAGQRTGGAFNAWLPGPDGHLRFDPTGIVKGWAVQEAFTRLADDLELLGAHDTLVNAGGDLALHCARSDTPDWTVGIEDPRDRTRMLRTLSLRNGAVATSGTAARGAHLIDPRTGHPASGWLSATVIGPDLTWADAYATAAFVTGARAAAWLATLDHHAALLLDPAGRLTSVGEVGPGSRLRAAGRASASSAAPGRP